MKTLNEREVRTVNVNQDRRQVYFHTNDGKTIACTMESKEISNIQRSYKDQQRVAEYVKLLNSKYLQPQPAKDIRLSPSDERFFELHNFKKICPLTGDEEEEYENLLMSE